MLDRFSKIDFFNQSEILHFLSDHKRICNSPFISEKVTSDSFFFYFGQLATSNFEIEISKLWNIQVSEFRKLFSIHTKLSKNHSDISAGAAWKNVRYLYAHRRISLI